ncbi:MAG: hypothetical protein R6U52_06570 [Kosmotogaceae bacterium]
MKNNYVHILYNEKNYMTPKKIHFNHRVKSGYLSAWSSIRAGEMLETKYWNCLSAYALESSMRRKIIFQRKHSNHNLLYFKYELEIPELIEAYYDGDMIKELVGSLSLRQITEDIVKFLESYEIGELNAENSALENWLSETLEGIPSINKEKLEHFVLKYTEIFITKIFWGVYKGDLEKLRWDSGSIVYLYTEMLSANQKEN